MKYILFEKVNMNYLNKVREELGLPRIDRKLKKRFCSAESEERAKEIVIEAVPYGFTLYYEPEDEFFKNADDHTSLFDDALLA